MIGTPSFKTLPPVLTAWLLVRKIGTPHFGKIMKTQTPSFIKGQGWVGGMGDRDQTMNVRFKRSIKTCTQSHMLIFIMML